MSIAVLLFMRARRVAQTEDRQSPRGGWITHHAQPLARAINNNHQEIRKGNKPI
ncbi:hypothetical protein [Mesorhizobium sp. 8]|uniref:hypothetical protein n=1 Tax=Mesorhizobium sp. 8 TaxID=2584466 RepID=UPI0015D670C2|nr:hypothetical protein [Mesorhizobium sp. 8]